MRAGAFCLRRLRPVLIIFRKLSFPGPVLVYYRKGYDFITPAERRQRGGPLKSFCFRLNPFKGRYSVPKSLIRRYFSDGVGRSAAALAYYLIFSLFPFLILLSAILSFLDLPPLTEESFRGLIPADIVEIVNSYLGHIAEIKNASLLFFGLVFTVYFTMRAVNCLLQSIHRAYRIQAKYTFLRHQLHVFLTTVFLIFIVFFSLALMTLGRSVLTWLSGWLPMLYFLVPNRQYSVKQVLPGAFAALLTWLAYSIGFAFYVENMGRYSVVYGSIGAVIVLLLWLYFSAITVIMGAELNHLLANRPKRLKTGGKSGANEKKG